MRFEFRNIDLVRINRNFPTSVRSTINVADVNGTISKVTLAFNICTLSPVIWWLP